MSSQVSPLYDEPFDVFGLVRRLVRYWRSILIITAVMAGLAAVIAFTAKPIYRAEIVVIPNSQQGQQSGMLAGLADQIGSLLPLPVNLGGNAAVEPVALLRSRALTEEFIQRNQLLPKLFPECWSDHKRGCDDEGLDAPTLRNAYTRFHEDIRRVDEDSVPGLVKLSIDFSDRSVVAAWANGLVALANEQTRTRTIEEATRRMQFLEIELERSTNLEVRQAIFRVMEAEVKAKMLANVQQDPAFRVLDPAVTPGVSEVVKPKRLLILVVGCWLGVCIGVVTAFARIALSERDRKRQLPVLVSQ